MPGHCRPPDHKCKLQSESWRVGITAVSPLVLVPQHPRKPHFDDPAVFPRSTMARTTRPLGSLRVLTH
ncbi:hypothetical protein K443DRAFT_681660 [Laccaria amethystina LaAM-08-1]|uniref:Uncharacterized protein n=1 Tax=Laccaria amethystina LaAM-08-1 TaxID=1095629 RepID=A0A0C9WLH9_9AGAR|nr:hypothetical protein K443DRAFT_681660 [Laccaria amethystina LaAM-08-1]